MHKICFIVPVYNNEEYIYNCIESIQKQVFPDYNLSFIDDGSSDKSGEICDVNALYDNRVISIHKPNSGVSDTRNIGLEFADVCSDVEWFTFVDSDDWIHPQYLETMYRAVTESGLDICSCNSKRVYEYHIDKNDDFSYTEESAEAVYTQFFKRGRDYVYGRLYRKALFNNIRYPGGKLFEDVATTYKILLSVDKIAYVEAPLYYYFYNENGIVHQKWSPKRMDEFDAYEEQLEYLSQHPEFIKTYKVIQRDYMQEISYSYFMLQQSDYEYKDYYLDILSGKMRAALKKYGKSAGITIKEHTNYYEIARLKRVNFYWKYQALKRKLIKR